MPKKRTPDDIFSEKVAHLLKSEKDMDAAVVKHQRKLFDLIQADYLPEFDVDKGILLDTDKNTRLILQIDRLFNRLEKALYKDVLAPFTRNLLQGVNLSAEYYVGMGFKKKVVNNLLADKVKLEKRLGITPKGRAAKGGYLHKLGKTNEVRQELVQYVFKNLTGDVAFTDFQLGFRNLVLGNKKKQGLATTGRLQRYFDQYAYDAFNQTDAIANKQFAAGLNLKHFVYDGSVIDTTRPFCRKRAGKAFSVAETKEWKNDPDLIDKKTADAYRPLIDRGRYRCRHFIKYITEALYNILIARE